MIFQSDAKLLIYFALASITIGLYTVFLFLTDEGQARQGGEEFSSNRPTCRTRRARRSRCRQANRR